MSADLIWDYPNPQHVILGDAVTFQASLDLGGPPVGLGSLMITADNAYTAKMNGAFLGAAQLGPGFPGEFRETVVFGPPIPKSGNWGVSSQGWQTVETWTVGGLVSGSNTLEIVAANEYMWNTTGYLGPDYYYSTAPYTSGAVSPDPFPGTGIGGTNLGDNFCRNPAGLIFKLEADYYDRSETAWGPGNPFSGNNWATYFTVEDNG